MHFMDQLETGGFCDVFKIVSIFQIAGPSSGDIEITECIVALNNYFHGVSPFKGLVRELIAYKYFRYSARSPRKVGKVMPVFSVRKTHEL
jgi:hypothetical protein